MLCSQGSVYGQLVTETLVESDINIPGLLVSARMHIIGQLTLLPVCGFSPCSVLHPRLFIKIILVAIIDAGNVGDSIIHVPTFSQAMFLGQKELPSVDTLAIFGIET